MYSYNPKMKHCAFGVEFIDYFSSLPEKNENFEFDIS